MARPLSLERRQDARSELRSDRNFLIRTTSITTTPVAAYYVSEFTLKRTIIEQRD